MCDGVKTIVEVAPKWPPASTSSGVKVMSIQGRLNRERERLAGCGMSDQERAWRAQWIRDQRLSDKEPVKVPQLEKERYNPFRRLYRYPLDQLEKRLVPKLGEANANLCRMLIGKSGLIIAGVYAAAYYFKYNTNDWTRKGGWRVVPNRRSVVPGDPGWPYQPVRTVGADYADRGFKTSPIQKPLAPNAQVPVRTEPTPEVTSPLPEVPDYPDVSDYPEVPDYPDDELRQANFSNETFQRSEKIDV